MSNLVVLYDKRFSKNTFVQNLDKMNAMKFITKDSSHSTLCIGCKEKHIEETVNKFFYTN